MRSYIAATALGLTFLAAAGFVSYKDLQSLSTRQMAKAAAAPTVILNSDQTELTLYRDRLDATMRVCVVDVDTPKGDCVQLRELAAWAKRHNVDARR